MDCIIAFYPDLLLHKIPSTRISLHYKVQIEIFEKEGRVKFSYVNVHIVLNVHPF